MSQLEARLHVSNIPFTYTETDLHNMMAHFGQVVEAEIIYNQRGSKGYGFVTMSSKYAAENARMLLNGRLVDDRVIEVNKATPPSFKRPDIKLSPIVKCHGNVTIRPRIPFRGNNAPSVPTSTPLSVRCDLQYKSTGQTGSDTAPALGVFPPAPGLLREVCPAGPSTVANFTTQPTDMDARSLATAAAFNQHQQRVAAVNRDYVRKNSDGDADIGQVWQESNNFTSVEDIRMSGLATPFEALNSNFGSGGLPQRRPLLGRGARDVHNNNGARPQDVAGNNQEWNSGSNPVRVFQQGQKRIFCPK